MVQSLNQGSILCTDKAAELTFRYNFGGIRRPLRCQSSWAAPLVRAIHAMGFEELGQRGANCPPVPAGAELVPGREYAHLKTKGKFVFYAEMSVSLPKLLKDDPRLAGLPHGAVL